MPPYSNTGDVLNAAASQSSIAMIDMLISHGAKIENRTALNHAVSSSNEDVERFPIMEHLLELGADINGMNLVGHGSKAGTPLHCTVKEGKLERARFLYITGQIRTRRIVGELCLWRWQIPAAGTISSSFSGDGFHLSIR